MATRQQRQQEEATEIAEETGTDPAIMAAAGSVLLSWYFFFVRGDREMGIFVGLWPPTVLAFASYFQQTRMSDRLERMMGRSGLRESIERVMQNR